MERPGKIVAVGMNYRDHAAEAGLEVPERPVLFGLWPSSVVAAGEPIVIPPFSSQIDYEAELGVVVGEHDQRFVAAELEGLWPPSSSWTRAPHLVASLVGQATVKARQGRLLGGLQHDGVPVGDGGRRLPGRFAQGKFHGVNQPDDGERAPQRVQRVAGRRLLYSSPTGRKASPAK